MYYFREVHTLNYGTKFKKLVVKLTFHDFCANWAVVSLEFTTVTAWYRIPKQDLIMYCQKVLVSVFHLLYMAFIFTFLCRLSWYHMICLVVALSRWIADVSICYLEPINCERYCDLEQSWYLCFVGQVVNYLVALNVIFNSCYERIFPQLSKWKLATLSYAWNSLRTWQTQIVFYTDKIITIICCYSLQMAICYDLLMRFSANYRRKTARTNTVPHPTIHVILKIDRPWNLWNLNLCFLYD